MDSDGGLQMLDGIEDPLLLQADRTKIHARLQLVRIQENRLPVITLGTAMISKPQCDIAQIGHRRRIRRIGLMSSP